MFSIKPEIMEQSKTNEMLMHLLINVQTELFTLKDFVLGEIIQRGNFSEDEKQVFERGYDRMRKEYQTAIIAQLRARYDERLGSVDDLLKGL